MPPLELTFITGNHNKLAEVQAILGDTVSLKSQSLNLTEIQGSIENIARDKCGRAVEIVREGWVHGGKSVFACLKDEVKSFTSTDCR